MVDDYDMMLQVIYFIGKC